MNNVRNFIIVAIVLVFAILGYLLLSNQAKPGPQPTPSPTQAPSPTLEVLKQTTVELSEVNKSDQSGVAELKEMNGKVLVTLTMNGSPSAIPQPAHIHVGKCPGVGAVNYPLSAVKDGSSETNLDISFDMLMSKLPLAINIHKSAAEVKVYTACGDLEAL